jgi:molecular chaperone HtpG
MMKKSSLSVHSENILPIIKKWLYSDKDIFIRELVSNACDALTKLNIVGAAEGELKVSIQIDNAKKAIVISDTGIGMTSDEVEKYIAQIAFSGATEFVEKYQSQTEKDPMIGHFGLGFYSAYMVASVVDIETLSYQKEAKPVFWTCDGSSSYSIGEGTRSTRGTTITLHLEPGSFEYLEESKLQGLLQRFCRFLPFPIDLNGKPLENGAPLWLKNPTDCTEKEYIDFYHSLFPLDPDPIFWIHLNVDYPFRLQGILYFPKVHRRFDTEESTIQLFCNRVFVSGSCKEFLPDYLTTLRGAIDSSDIPLNVSRSYLQVDSNVRQLSAHISKKVSDKLLALHKSDKKTFLEYWPDLEMIVKLGALQDDKFFERVQEVLLWKNSQDEWVTPAEALKKRSDNKVLYTTLSSAGPLLAAYKEKGHEFLWMNSSIDLSMIHLLEGKLSCKFQRLDSAMDDTLLDTAREKTLLDSEGKTESSRIASAIAKNIDLPDVDVEAKSLAADSLPGFVLFSEEERRFRDYMAMSQGKSEPLRGKKKFIVNTNNKLIQAIGRLTEKQPDIAKDLSLHLFELSLLTQKELPPKEAQEVLHRQTLMLEKLASLV